MKNDYLIEYVYLGTSMSVVTSDLYYAVSVFRNYEGDSSSGVTEATLTLINNKAKVTVLKRFKR